VKAPPEVLLPAAIIAERARLIRRQNFMRAWHPLLDRLCKTTVWNQLGKYKPVVTRAELIERIAAAPKWCMGSAPDEKWSDRDLALQAAFLRSFFLAVEDPQTITLAEKREIVDSRRERAKQLREVAEWFEKIGVTAHRDTCESLAAWCESEADEVAGWDDATVVARNQTSPWVRAYCVQLAHVMRLLYGKQCRGIVAAIASAVLGRNVTRDHVRYWCVNKDA
jgi:hypothetical protein